MHGTIQQDCKTPNEPADKGVRKSVRTGRKSVSEENWFADMCRELLAKPGLELHLLTGIDERSCHRYACGEVKPSGGLIRALLRSARGEAFVEYLMQDAADDWWRKYHRRIRAAKAFEREMESP